MRRTRRRFLNESDFPFTAEEVLEQIETEITKLIKSYKANLKEFENDVINKGYANDQPVYRGARLMAKIVILNDAYSEFEDVRDGIISVQDAIDDINQWRHVDAPFCNAFNDITLPFFWHIN